MKDINGTIKYKGKEYRIIFNLNVMEKIQEEYGSIEAWGELTEKSSEPNIKAVKFGFTEMINEAIDIGNEENGTDNKFLTTKQVGRMITEIGLDTIAKSMNDTVVASTSSAEKNA